MIDPQTLKEFFSERHSVRKFEDRDIPREVIQSLIEAAAFIPSGGNRHGHGFTVITRGGKRVRLMEALSVIYRRRSRLMNSPLLRTVVRPFVDAGAREFLRDKEYGPRMRELIGKLEAGEDPIFHGAPAAIVIHSPFLIPTPKEDCVIAGFVICLSAQAAGLGACFVTLGQNAINGSRGCKEILGLSPGERVHAVVVVGYPAAANRRKTQRPAKEIQYV